MSDRTNSAANNIMPEKGLGVVAVKPIGRGTLILQEAPLFTMGEKELEEGGRLKRRSGGSSSVLGGRIVASSRSSTVI